MSRKSNYASPRLDVLLKAVMHLKGDFALLEARLKTADSIVIFKAPEPEQVGQVGEHQVTQEG